MWKERPAKPVSGGGRRPGARQRAGRAGRREGCKAVSSLPGAGAQGEVAPGEQEGDHQAGGRARHGGLAARVGLGGEPRAPRPRCSGGLVGGAPPPGTGQPGPTRAPGPPQEQESVRAAPEKSAAPTPDVVSSMLTDTTAQHRAHLFDLNCRVCTGAPPPPAARPGGLRGWRGQPPPPTGAAVRTRAGRFPAVPALTRPSSRNPGQVSSEGEPAPKRQKLSAPARKEEPKPKYDGAAPEPAVGPANDPAPEPLPESASAAPSERGLPGAPGDSCPEPSAEGGPSCPAPSGVAMVTTVTVSGRDPRTAQSAASAAPTPDGTPAGRGPAGRPEAPRAGAEVHPRQAVPRPGAQTPAVRAPGPQRQVRPLPRLPPWPWAGGRGWACAGLGHLPAAAGAPRP